MDDRPQYHASGQKWRFSCRQSPGPVAATKACKNTPATLSRAAGWPRHCAGCGCRCGNSAVGRFCTARHGEAYSWQYKVCRQELLILSPNLGITRHYCSVLGQLWNWRALSKETTQEQNETFDRRHIIGRSQGLMEVLNTIARIAKTNASVLITGESGTGKELIAEAIHINSQRARQPFC